MRTIIFAPELDAISNGATDFAFVVLVAFPAVVVATRFAMRSGGLIAQNVLDVSKSTMDITHLIAPGSVVLIR